MKQLSVLAFGLTVAFATGAAWSQDKIGDAAAGAGKAAMCVGCHGIVRYQTNFPTVYKVPKIGGQSAKYIISSLTAYQKDERKHPSMRAISQSLTEQDMADLAAFYSSQGKGGEAKEPVKLDKVPEPATAVAELIKKGACISCHGEGFRKPIDPSYPKIAGQYPDYVSAALKAYKVDHEYFGRTNAIMGGIAKQFSNAELSRIADYVSTIDSELRTPVESRFR